MSQKNELSNSKESARNYVDWLSGLGVAEKIFIGGSRSPSSKRGPHKHSDWDFTMTTKVEALKILNPRQAGVMHADLLILPPEYWDAAKDPKLVEVWPNDNQGILK